MIRKKIELIKDKPNVTLDCYIAEYTTKTRYGMLIIPGGGYSGVCSDREGYPIAEAFIPYNFNCFILNYSVGKDALFPEPLIEASLAMKYIKEHAQELKVDPEHISCVGFSAGGHLAASLATMWHTVDIKPYGINKPFAGILCYPVLTGKQGHEHLGSFQAILGKEDLTSDEREKYSIENHIDKNTCPLFLMHTADDSCVPCESSLYAALKCKEKGIPFELHIYKHGKHGLALGNEITGDSDYCEDVCAEWVKKSVRFIKNL